MSFSRIGTFIVFVYVWLPFMILPIQAAVVRIPRSLLEASGDLGATPAQTFRTPDPAAGPARRGGGLHLHFLPDAGDYIIPGIIGNSTMYIGQVVYMQQGTAGNLPFAAAFSLVPILIIAIYLTIAKRLGPSMRFDTHMSLIHTRSQVPILIMAIHLTTAKRLGAFDAL